MIADNTTVITPPSPQRVITCSQCGHSDVHYRIDRLSRQLDSLELSVSSDIKTILHILKHKNGDFLTTEVSIVEYVYTNKLNIYLYTCAVSVSRPYMYI